MDVCTTTANVFTVQVEMLGIHAMPDGSPRTCPRRGETLTREELAAAKVDIDRLVSMGALYPLIVTPGMTLPDPGPAVEMPPIPDPDPITSEARRRK